MKIFNTTNVLLSNCHYKVKHMMHNNTIVVTKMQGISYKMVGMMNKGTWKVSLVQNLKYFLSVQGAGVNALRMG